MGAKTGPSAWTLMCPSPRRLGWSIPDGYESSVSFNDVFARKMIKKVKAAENKYNEGPHPWPRILVTRETPC